MQTLTGMGLRSSMTGSIEYFRNLSSASSAAGVDPHPLPEIGFFSEPIVDHCHLVDVRRNTMESLIDNTYQLIESAVINETRTGLQADEIVEIQNRLAIHAIEHLQPALDAT